MWNTSERGILCKVGLYIICDSLIAEKGAFSQHTAVWRGSASFFCALAMSHAWTRLLPSDVSWLTIEWQQSWTHTANAATIASCEAAQRYVGMAHCVEKSMWTGRREDDGGLFWAGSPPKRKNLPDRGAEKASAGRGSPPKRKNLSDRGAEKASARARQPPEKEEFTRPWG